MPWTEVFCPSEKCPGRQVAHGADCSCGGTGRRPGQEQRTYIDCEDGEVKPLRWMAFWHNTTLSKPGGWAASIRCPRCGEHGEDVPD